MKLTKKNYLMGFRKDIVRRLARGTNKKAILAGWADYSLALI